MLVGPWGASLGGASSDPWGVFGASMGAIGRAGGTALTSKMPVGLLGESLGGALGRPGCV